MGKIIWRSFKVGGNPDKEFCLAEDLYREIERVQECGWDIERIDCNTISGAWSCEQQKMVTTVQYIIIAKGEVEEDESVSGE